VNALVAIGEGLAELSLGTDDDSTLLAFGGDASNVAVMAARLGADVRIAGAVGDDALGRRLLAFWQDNGIETTGVKAIAEAPTGLYINESGEQAHRFIYWRKGSAGSRFAPEDLDAAVFDNLALLVITGVTLAVSEALSATAATAIAAARAREARVACVLNHRPALGGDVGALATLARESDIVVASRDDARLVFGTDEPAALRALLAPGPDELVVTDGSRPVIAFHGRMAVRQPIPTTRVRNAGGAGDALAGAYFAARVRGLEVIEGLRYGVAAAALSVGRDGCASSYPALTEVEALARELPAIQAVADGAAS
jgi:2-dehydro-3-deoxygluconokinase